MAPIGRVSDEEVSAVIRYLDPDLDPVPKSQSLRALNSGFDLRGTFLVILGLAILLATAATVVPILMRLLD